MFSRVRRKGAFSLGRVSLAATLCLGVLPRVDGLTIEELVGDARLTPKRFAAQFERFEYEFSPQILPVEEFLGAERGDCDDYAVLADYVLKPKGFATRVIHVRLVGRVAHAVCYVGESSAYLDYNNRKYFFSLERCGRRLRDIATKVAESFSGNWTSASEFTYDYIEGKKHFGSTVVKTEPPSSDPDQLGGQR
jgi:hypothetical protein